MYPASSLVIFLPLWKFCDILEQQALKKWGSRGTGYAEMQGQEVFRAESLSESGMGLLNAVMWM